MNRQLQYHIGLDNKWILREYGKDVIINQFNYFIIGLIYSVCYAQKHKDILGVHGKDGRIWFVT